MPRVVAHQRGGTTSGTRPRRYSSMVAASSASTELRPFRDVRPCASATLACRRGVATTVSARQFRSRSRTQRGPGHGYGRCDQPAEPCGGGRMRQQRHLVRRVELDEAADAPSSGEEPPQPLIGKNALDEVLPQARSESRPSSSTGRCGKRCNSASAKIPRPERCGTPEASNTLTRSIPQLGESFFNT